MSIWKHTFRGVFILGNLIVGTGFLCCAYSPLVSPVAHPVLACAGLFFPFFLLALIVLAVVGLEVYMPSCAAFTGWRRGSRNVYSVWRRGRTCGRGGTEISDL